jgi:hypothetical protein
MNNLSMEKNKMVERGNVVVDIVGLDHDFELAIKLIEKTRVENGYDFKLKICVDYSLTDSLGLYYYDEPIKLHNLYVNPTFCDKLEECKFGYPGYINDDTVFGVIIHEFCHFLTKIQLKNFEEEYFKTFPKERIIFSKYSNEELLEEIAEVTYLYLTNPFLIKSPTPYSKIRAKNLYFLFPEDCKLELREMFKIVYNVEKECFEYV